MRMELLRGAAKSLLGRRSQLSLTVWGIAIGVFSVLVISAVGGAGQNLMDRELEKLGFDCITVSASQSELGALDADALAQVNGLGEVSLAAPLTTSLGRASMREYVGDVLLCGVDQNAGEIIQLELVSGRLLREEDIRQGARCCVVDEKLAYAFYKRTNIVGKEMEVTVDQGTETFTVVGVVSGESSAIKNLVGDYVPSFVYLPYTTLQSLCRKSSIDQFFVRLAPDSDPEAAGQAVTSLLDSLAGYRNLYRYEDLALQKDRLGSILEAATAALSAIGGISLLVSGLSIMTIMTVSVRDRTREIGVKKAVGAKTSQILREFMAEAILLTLAGSALGILVSKALTAAAGLVLGVEFPLGPGAMAATLLFSVVVGAVFGVRPALLASRLSPVEALRHE